MSPPQDPTAAQLRRARSNARLLADELARRDAGATWNRRLVVTPDLGTARPGDRRDRFGAVSHRGAGRVAVVCWDLGHNPAGRAMVLADLHLEKMRVDLVGPLWSRFGDTIWSPIADGDYSTVTFRCDSYADFMAKAYAVASDHPYDLVHICKPRLPGLVLGSMLATASDCPVIVDIDDDEQAFSPTSSEVVTTPDGSIDLDQVDLDDLGTDPTEGTGTALGVALSRNAPVRTVSNVELQREHGGIMVRHARSEVDFDPDTVSRTAGRDRIGAAPDDFVVMFVGTPRPHKGLDVVIDALRGLDDRFVLHVVGVADRQRFEAEMDTTGARVVSHPPTDMAILPELIAAGDAIALMQHLDDPISRSQIPAKISDGLAMGRPVIVTDAPPLRDLRDHGLLRANDAAELGAALSRLAEGEGEEEGVRRRQAFLGEFSVAVNSARVRLADTAASSAADECAALTSETVELARTAYLAERRRERPDLFDRSDPCLPDGIDIAVFWKQNDTGIYGRRSDMIAKHFASDPRVRRVVHFDAPVSTGRAARDTRVHDSSSADHAPFLCRQLLDRRLQILETGAVHHRTFLYSNHEGRDPITGSDLPGSEGFADFVMAEMAALDMDPRSTLAWVCPVVAGFPEVHRALGFHTVVSDVIDDQRAFNHKREIAQEIDEQYREMLEISHRVFTNCEPNVRAFADYASSITVVPNGAETSAFDPQRRTVDDDDPPVVAYVGNMSDRVDWALLDELATLRPDHHFLMIGSAHYGGGVHELAADHDNVELVGVVPYVDLPEILRDVDVALVPHLAGPLTDRMNPLKVYNYYAAGVPIVSTPIPNIDELHEFISVATDARSFAAAIDRGVASRRAGTVPRDAALLGRIDWSTRTSAILDALAADGLLPTDRHATATARNA